MADWIWMPFGVVSGVGVCVCVGLESGERGRSRDGLLDAGGDGRRKGCFIWGRREFGAPIVSNGTLLYNCARATRSSQMTLGRTCL